MSNARRVHFSRRRPSGPLRSRRRMQPRHLARRARLRLRHARREVLAVLAVAVALLVVATGVTVAFFTSSGSSTASATAGTLNPPTNVTATQVTNTTNVTVSWTASAGTTIPTGYYVTRTATGGSPVAACGTSATSLITAVTCTDSSVAAGTYTYRVVAVFRSWTATSSPSAALTVTAPTPPTITSGLSNPNGGAYAAQWGDTDCANGATSSRRACAFVTANAGTVTSVTVLVKRSSDNACHDGSDSAGAGTWSTANCATPRTMTLVSGTLWESGRFFGSSGYAPDDTFTFTFTATNSTGASSSLNVVRLFDTANPTASIAPATSGSYTTTGDVTISGSDANGIASISYRLNANSGNYVTVPGAGPLTINVLAGSNQIDYYVTDAAGKQSTIVSNHVVIRDNTPPTITNLVPSAASGATWGDVACTLGGNPNPTLRICATVGDNFVVGNVYYELKRSDGACYDGNGSNATADWGTANCGLTTSTFLMASTGGVYRSAQILSSGYNDEDTYTVRVFGSDLAGNTTSVTSTFKLGTGPSLSAFLPAAGGNYRVSGTGGTQWSGICTSGRVCVNATDPSGIDTVKYELFRVNTNGGTARCWNGTSFSNNNSCSPITMTLDTGDQYVGNPIASALINAAKNGTTDGSWRLRITATDALGFTTTSAVQSFSFNNN